MSGASDDNLSVESSATWAVRSDELRWLDYYVGQLGPEFDKEIGQNVTRFRKAMGMSQADLAAAISSDSDVVHQQTIQKIEKGTRPLRYGEALRICATLRITPTQLGDPPPRAKVSAEFQQSIKRVHDDKDALLALADRLAASLTGLATIVGCDHSNPAGPTLPEDSYLSRRARQLLAANFGQLLNTRLLIEIGGDTAATTAEALQKVIDQIQQMAGGPPGDQDQSNNPDT